MDYNLLLLFIISESISKCRPDECCALISSTTSSRNLLLLQGMHPPYHRQQQPLTNTYNNPHSTSLATRRTSPWRHSAAVRISLLLLLLLLFAAAGTSTGADEDEERRLACAELFTCRSTGHLHLKRAPQLEITDRVAWSTQFHALAGQRELHALATRLVDTISASLERGASDAAGVAAAARDVMLERRDACRAELALADVAMACDRPRANVVLTLVTHPKVDPGAGAAEFKLSVESFHYVLPRNGSDWDVRCAAASEAAAAAAFAAPDPLFWPDASHPGGPPPGAAPERFFWLPGGADLGRPRDGASLCDLVRRSVEVGDVAATALLDANAAMRGRLKAARELDLGKGLPSGGPGGYLTAEPSKLNRTLSSVRLPA